MAQAERSFKKRGKGKAEEQKKIKYELLPRLSREQALIAHKDAMGRGADCTQCALFGLRAGPVMSEVTPNARLVVIGETARAREVEQGRPFIGASGQVVFDAIADGGITRDECSVTNVLSCCPPEEFKAFEYRLKLLHDQAIEAWEALEPQGVKGDPVFQEAHDKWKETKPVLRTPTQCCEPRLRRDIEESQSKFVLALGSAALKAVANYWNVPSGTLKKVKAGTLRIGSLKKQLGAPIHLPDGTIAIGTYHPAFAMRAGSRHYAHVIRDHIVRAAKISRRGCTDWSEPEYILSPNVTTIETVLDRMFRAGVPVTVDIETDQGTRNDGRFDPFSCRIRCIGFGARVDNEELVICVPIRRISGEEWWSTSDEKMRVIQACMNVLNSNPLIGQNLAFDTQVLLRFRLMLDRRTPWMDTMLMHRNTIDCDLPHDLGFIASRYFEVPNWKSSADDKFYDGVTDEVLQKYNCLNFGTPVMMADGSTRSIQDLVRNKVSYPVLSLSSEGKIEAKKIIGWHRKREPGTQWWQIRQIHERKNCRGLITTPEHQIYTTRGRIRADEVVPGDRILVPEMALSRDMRQALIGTMIGDARGQVSPVYRGRWTEAGTAYLDGCHRTTDGLAELKAVTMPEVFKLIGYREEQEKEILGIPTIQHRATNYMTEQTSEIRELLLLTMDPDGTRRLRIEALEQLGSIGLAWWFMDDGCRQNGQKTPTSGVRGAPEYQPDKVNIAACRYPREDGERAADWFRKHYGPTSYCADKCLRLGVEASRKFCQEVAKFIPECLRHKLPRNVDHPAYEPRVLHKENTPASIEIEISRPYEIKRTTRETKSAADTRWCITVEGNHNFFTSFGLVKNCSDVYLTMRLAEKLSEEILRYGTSDQNEQDMAMAPPVRDMGLLGLFIDEEMRGKFSLLSNSEVFKRLMRLKQIVGDNNYNPNSPHQVRKYLFGTKKMIPSINTKGRDFEEGEDPATNAKALVDMTMKQACDDEVKEFINTTLEMRAYAKLSGTYLDKVRVDYPDWSKYGFNISRVPAVRTQAFRAYKKSEMKALGTTDLGVWEEHEILPERSALSHLNITFKQQIVSSGRLASTPNAQNIPCVGKMNVREMYVAPPGHQFIGADLDQLELRLYAVIAGDKLMLDAFTKPGRDGKAIDPHSLNAASMFAGKFSREYGRKVDIPEAYAIIMALPDKEKKKLRGYAKTFCIAEGELVLTNVGLVPIEDVTTQHKVWDGVAWVSHVGVVCQGTKEVVFHDGLWATEDHKVWLETGERSTHGEAQTGDRCLARTGTDRIALRYCGGREGKIKKLQGNRKSTSGDRRTCRVYDVINAGPRRRFTVSNVLVSNCYLVIYGGEKTKLFGTMSTARDKATGTLMFPNLKEEDVFEWHDQWFRTHPETHKWQENCERAARIEGYTCSPIGTHRRRFFPGGSNKPGATYNHVNQCSGSEIANPALLYIADHIPYQGWSPFSGLCGQVHDWIGVYAPTERAEEAVRIVEKAMNTMVMGIKISATAKISKRWSDQ